MILAILSHTTTILVAIELDVQIHTRFCEALFTQDCISMEGGPKGKIYTSKWLEARLLGLFLTRFSARLERDLRSRATTQLGTEQFFDSPKTGDLSAFWEVLASGG